MKDAGSIPTPEFKIHDISDIADGSKASEIEPKHTAVSAHVVGTIMRSAATDTGQPVATFSRIRPPFNKFDLTLKASPPSGGKLKRRVEMPIEIPTTASVDDLMRALDESLQERVSLRDLLLGVKPAIISKNEK